MDDVKFILDNIRFSYSSISTFETCPLSFKLAYIDALPRIGNFYSEYGTLIHEVLEKYWKKELEVFELTEYFKKQFDSVVVTPAPVPPEGLGEKYYQQGIEFFNNVSLLREQYEVIVLEEMINFDYKKFKMVVKPDLVLQNKKTGKYSLWDYKSSTVYRTDRRGRETEDTKKLEGYYKQTYFYAYALRKFRKIKIDEIVLWFTRPEKQLTIPWDKEKEKEVMLWVDETLAKIQKQEYPYNNTGSYFCNNLCGVRNFCEYR